MIKGIVCWVFVGIIGCGLGVDVLVDVFGEVFVDILSEN